MNSAFREQIMRKESLQIQHRQILDNAIAALAESVGVRVKATKAKDPKADYDLKIDMSGRNEILLAEVKRTLTEATLGQLVVQKFQTEKKWVLVTEHIRPTQAEILKNLDIAYFDTTGNAYFNLPGLHIFINTNRPAATKASRSVKRQTFSGQMPGENFRPSELKILFALLSEPGLEQANYRTIASKANVALGTIAWHMNKLRDGGFLGPKGEHDRKLRNKKKLFNQWVDGYIRRLRPKLLLSRLESDLKKRWWEDIDLRKYRAYWGGEIAAERLTRYLRPAHATIYAGDALPRLQVKYKLKRKATGDVEILEKFWAEGKETDIAPPLVVYADLLATGDSRNIEAAQLIYDEFINQLVGENSR